MKRTSFLIALAVMMFASADAQYKKASFFTRNGKFYGLKAGMHLFGNGVAATPSVAFIYGKDQGKNRVWHWWDLEYTAPSKYKYSTVSFSDENMRVDVSGKVNGMLTWRYNWAYYLADNKNEDIKGLPFLKAAVEVVLAGRMGREETYTPAESPKQYTYQSGANGGVDLGAGYTYRISEVSTLFGVAGYRLILNQASEYENFYFPTPSHPYVNIGIRFARKNDD